MPGDVYTYGVLGRTTNLDFDICVDDDNYHAGFTSGVMQSSLDGLGLIPQGSDKVKINGLCTA